MMKFLKKTIKSPEYWIFVVSFTAMQYAFGLKTTIGIVGAITFLAMYIV